MGCFRACFSLSKSRKLGKSAIKTSLRDHIKRPAEAIHPADFEPKSRGELEKYANLDIVFKFAASSSFAGPQIELENAQELVAKTAKRKVTFDLFIKENASDHMQNSCATIYPADELENDTDHSIAVKQNAQNQEHLNGAEKVARDAESPVEIDDRLVPENNGEKSCGKTDVKGEEIEEAIQDLLESKASPYPANHRYGNCNDEESQDREIEENNFDEEDEQNNNQNDTVIPPESSGSLFSLSIDFNAQGLVDENGEKEVNSTVKMSDRENQNEPLLSHCVDSVSNLVENLTHWNAAKEKTAQPFGHHQEKENISLETEYKSRERNSKHRIAVDTSLSSWLVESENTPKSKNSDNSNGHYSPLEKGSSGRSYEDRPILGALTMEDLKQLSASPSQLRTRRGSPAETPIVGTVGSYWNHTPKDLKQLSVSSSPIRSRSR